MGDKKVLEKDSLKEILYTLGHYKKRNLLDYWRISVGGVPNRHGRLRPNPQMKGFPDVIILYGHAKTAYLEAKGSAGKLSPDQILFRERAAKFNAPYFVVRNAQDVMFAMGLLGLQL